MVTVSSLETRDGFAISSVDRSMVEKLVKLQTSASFNQVSSNRLNQAKLRCELLSTVILVTLSIMLTIPVPAVRRNKYLSISEAKL